MKGLDFKHFKKVKSEGEHTTLRHYAGHEIKIKHSALSTKMREQLEALPTQKSAKMADGGKVADKKTDNGLAASSGGGALPVDSKRYKDAQAMGKGMEDQGMQSGKTDKSAYEGDPYGYAKGGAVNPKLEQSKKDPTQEHLLPGDAIPNKTEKYAVASVKSRMYADGTPDAPVAPIQGAEDVGQAPPAPEAQVDPERQQKIGLYNQLSAAQLAQASPDADPTSVQFGPNGEPPKDFMSSAWNAADQKHQADQKVAVADQATQAQATADTNKARLDAGLPPIASPAAPNAPKQPKVANPYEGGPATPPAQPEGPGMMEGYAGNMTKGFQLQSQGIEEQKQAAQQSAQQQAKLLDMQAQQNLKQANEQQERIATFQKANQDFIHDVQNGYINPNHMMESKSAGQKVGTAIGLLLGGMSAGMTGQGNPAMDFINKQIDRDISAQQHNLAAKENLLHHNLQQFNDVNTATAVTRMQYNDYYMHMIDKAKETAASPAAQGAADMAKGELLQKNAMIMSMLGQSGKIPGQSGSSGDSTEAYLNMLRMTDPARAKEIESRYVPGIGVATVPLSETTRATITERQTLGKNLQQLLAFQAKYGGTLEGIRSPTVKAEGKALANQVQDQYRRANQQGVFKPAEAAFVNGVIADNPSSLFSKWTKAPAYRAAIKINEGNLNAIYNQVGLKPQGGQSQGAGGFVPKTFKPAR